MSVVSGYFRSLCHGVRSGKSEGLSLVNTELNCAFKISAFSLGVSFTVSLTLRGAMSMESVFLCLMNVHSFLLFELLSVSAIRFSVYDQYASLVALLIFFLSDLNFSLRLSVGFCFILLNR